MGIAVIGSTGSIGQSTLKIAKRLNLKIDALVAFGNLELLLAQQNELNADYIGVIDETIQKKAAEVFPYKHAENKLITGNDALTKLSALKNTGTVVVAVTGVNGLISVVSAVRAGKRIALANKESLVSGGEIVKTELENSRKNGHNPVILPVDSEHSAIFQCIEGLKNKTGKNNEKNKTKNINRGLVYSDEGIKRIILTASGGAFYNRDTLEGITAKDISHPSYRMGRKITVDSCTMMNKSLEIIEAYHLFGCNNIDYAIHPQSIIHSMIELNDGSVLAQLAPPDMTLPIQYALTYPKRVDCPLPALSFDSPLIFKPKNQLFNAPELAKEVIKAGKNAGAIFNAANEAAVALFEKGLISFKNIVKIVEKCLAISDILPVYTCEDVLNIHNLTINKVNLDYNNLIK